MSNRSLDVFEQALLLAARAARLQAMAVVMGRDVPPGLHRRILELAVQVEDAARNAANRVRVKLGGEPIPDPAEPPPVRPDD